MVGDGSNEIDALEQVDKSIAMSQGSNVARDVAKMTIIPSEIPVCNKV